MPTYYIISLNSTLPKDDYINLWQNRNNGRTYSKTNAGVYTEIGEGDFNSYNYLPVETLKLDKLFLPLLDTGEIKHVIPNHRTIWEILGLRMRRNGLVRKKGAKIQISHPIDTPPESLFAFLAKELPLVSANCRIQNLEKEVKELRQQKRSLEMQEFSPFLNLKKAVAHIRTINAAHTPTLLQEFALYTRQEIPNEIAEEFVLTGLSNEELLTSDYLTKRGYRNLLTPSPTN